MDSLPVEILEQICSLLCFHCQNPEAFPNADSDDVRLNKASLSRLARTSKSLYSTVQPFVYHYYATGNLPQTIKTVYYMNTTTYPSDDDKLSRFLRTIIQRPDLAAHVKALQVVESSSLSSYTPDIIPMLQSATESLGLTRYYHEYTAYDRYAKPLCTHSSHEGDRRGVHKRLEELAILLLPKVETLLVCLDYPHDYRDIKESGRVLPALKTLALRHYSSTYHLHNAKDLYAAAPNLETLYVIDMSASDDLNYDTGPHPWTLGLAGLRKLTLNDPPFDDDLDLLLGCCSSLSELHFSYLNHLDDRNYWDMTYLINCLQPVKEQLHKLTLTFVPLNSDSDPEDPCPHSYELTLKLNPQRTIIDTMRDFENLEVLAVDQAALCLLNDPFIASDRLIQFLPASIREVHFYFVYRSFLAALEALVYDAPRRFPHLRVIHISLADRIEMGRVKELEEMRAIDPITRGMGIEVQWSTTLIGGHPWAALPGLCPGSDYLPFFSSYKISAYKLQ